MAFPASVVPGRAWAVAPQCDPRPVVIGFSHHSTSGEVLLGDQGAGRAARSNAATTRSR